MKNELKVENGLAVAELEVKNENSLLSVRNFKDEEEKVKVLDYVQKECVMKSDGLYSKVIEFNMVNVDGDLIDYHWEGEFRIVDNGIAMERVVELRYIKLYKSYIPWINYDGSGHFDIGMSQIYSDFLFKQATNNY